MTGSKRVDHWTSGIVYECSEIAGSPKSVISPLPTPVKKKFCEREKGGGQCEKRTKKERDKKTN
jgi:nicotinic acid phosphoribosyltransferase